MNAPLVHLVDDDEAVRLSLERLLRLEGYQVKTYASAEQFLKVLDAKAAGCLLTDVRMPGGMSGIDMLATLKKLGVTLPTVVMTGYGDIPSTVRAMKLGAIDFLTKPVRINELLKTLRDCIADADARATSNPIGSPQRFDDSGLSRRELEVIQLVVDGEQNKEIARLLGISPRTVEIHRSNGMKKLGVSSIHALLKVANAEDVVQGHGAVPIYNSKSNI